MSRKTVRYLLLIGIPVLTLCVLCIVGGGYLLIKNLPQQPTPTTYTRGIPVNTGGSTTTYTSSSGAGENGFQMTIRLSEGKAQLTTAEPVQVINGEPLSEKEIQQIIARLPQMTPVPGDQTDFNLAGELLPPPLTGETISEPFPPVTPAPAQPDQPGPTQPAAPDATQPSADESGPLEVLRYAPEGEISVAPFVNITFNQPMVPLDTVENLALLDVPVLLDPPLEGTWRWLGTKTLTFEYASDLIDRLPKATTFKVTIPAGTKSVTGGVLAEAVEWTFTTPPPVMTFSYPYSYAPQPLEPVFFVAFDQRIDPAAVLETIRVTADGNPVGITLITEEDVKNDEQAAQLLKYTLEGRWLAFRANEPLPADSSIVVEIGPGTPSAEGPLTTTAVQPYQFRTYAPLRIEDHGCYYYERCRPLNPFYVRFNNALDANAYLDTMLSIEPELPGASVSIIGNTIEIHGASKGQTTYTVTISPDLQDTFGQKLGEEKQVSFKVGTADPLLVGPRQIFVTLDPALEQSGGQKPSISVYTINYSKLDVQIYAVQPFDWPGFQKYLADYNRSDEPITPPGRLVFDEEIQVEAATDTLTEVKLDLSKEMDGNFGHFIVVVAPPEAAKLDKYQRFYQTIHTWVQVTQIGLDAFVDPDEMTVWTTALKDGAPLSGVTITAGPSSDLEVVTGEDGTVHIPIPAGASYLVAKQGADQAMLPRSTYYWSEDAWNSYSPGDDVHWYVFDDRKMYRPGEDVHIKGWLRRIGGGTTGDVSLVNDIISMVHYTINDPQGNEIGSGQAEVSLLGGFDFAFTLPETVNLGQATITMLPEKDNSWLGIYQYYHSFQIQEFRTPEFEVTARNESSGPYFAGDSAVVAVKASYYAGGPLANADVNWSVSFSPSSYSPPNWSEFTFGTWQPRWWYWEESYYGGYNTSGTTYQTFTGKTDAAGEHYLQLDFEGTGTPRPVSVSASSTVMDVNRQAWTGATTLLVHPSSLYVGMRSERYFVNRGTPLKIELIVTDIDGNPVADRQISVRAARMEWKYSGGSWQEVEADVQECTVGSLQEPVSCTFETPTGGTYRIKATVIDGMGRQNQSQFERWVSGGQRPTSLKVEQEEVTLIPDRETYQAGDVAHILVQSPFVPAEGLLTVSRSGTVYTQRFSMQEGTTTLDVPIEESYIPNLNVQVDLVGSATRLDANGNAVPDAPARPAYATGTLHLPIPPLLRTLTLQVLPEASELEPGGETSLAVRVTDANGQPVANAELAVVIVDEAVLALSNYQLADPLSIFYPERGANLSSTYGRASIILVDPQALAESANQVAQDQVMEKVAMEAVPAAMPTQTPAATAEAGRLDVQDQQPEIRVRVNFNPLATFAPAVTTDADGRAQVTITLPDNLTRYRVMVVAVDDSGRKFGTGESNMVARLPLMARPSAPRFLNFGDTFELPVVLQNQTDQPMEVDVVVQASNLILTAGNGLRVTVPARDRVEVRFPATTDLAGTARLQIAAVSGSYSDAAVIELPVYTPATTEAFATYGVVDDGTMFQPIAAPTGVFTQYGGLEINTSSTALQALTDAVLYLTSYKFECSEQLASRVLAVSSLRDVLTAFEADGLPSPEAMEAAVVRDIERLKGMQNYDGGFPYWRRGFDSIPFNTIHVAYALQRAEDMGFTVPPEMKQSALEYLRQIENYYPYWYGTRTRQTLSAYALFVRNLMNDRDATKALNLLNEAGLENLSLEAVGWLWPVIDDEASLEAIRRHVNNRVVETAGAANFTTYYDEQTYLLLSSNRRTDAILLDALIEDNPQSDLIPKVVAGLLAHRTRGHWGNTQENVFVLLALDRYFKTYESQTPDFVARIWLGETYAGSHEYQGYSTERHETIIPMDYLVNPALGGGQTQDLAVSKEGVGRLYYRLGLRYAPKDLNLDAVDNGFVVQRQYEAVDNPDDVSRDENGVWHIKAGARVRVRITMVADNRRYHVALVDPLPAGLEIVNPTLAVSGNTPQDPNANQRYGWWWYWTWYEHQNLRDERAEAFTSLLWDGVYEYTYLARATTPGTFIAPPAKAEEMYSPEVFGRSGSDWVIVK